jgi:hypothetical protein
MSNKENKGGLLSNEQVEKDIQVKGKKEQEGGYVGMQDTGDEGVRSMGSEVQQRDGMPPENEEK